MLVYRKADINDINKLVELRKEQLIDEGLEPSIDIDDELKSFFERHLASGSLIQWLVCEKEEVIACGAIIFYDFPPSYINKSGRKAYIANMYTKESYRGKGIATNMLTRLVDEAKKLGVTKVWLAASKLGRPVYKKFGFKETDEFLELNI